jgi:RNA recognition motif-containing protein
VRIDRTTPDPTSVATFNLFVTNISWTMMRQELMELFAAYKPVDAEIVTNMYGKSRGFGTVKFAQEEDAIHAIEGINKVEINGRQIRVRYSSF